MLRCPLPCVQVLDVAACRLLTDMSILFVSDLNKLRCLHVHGCPLISLDGLRALSKLAFLEHVSIPPAARSASVAHFEAIARDVPALQAVLDDGLDCNPVLRVWDDPDLTCWQPAISALPPTCVPLSLCRSVFVLLLVL